MTLNAEWPPTDTMRMMRRVILVFAGVLAGAVFVASCGGGATINSTSHPVASTELAASSAELIAAPEWSPNIDTRPQYAGFGSLVAEPQTQVALARGDIDVFATPDATETKLTIPRTTILGTVTVLTVVDQPSPQWVEVMLPIRPNGSTGFVRTAAVEIYAVGGKILIDLSDRMLTYTIDNSEIVSTAVAIGTSANPTPTGTFFVTDNVTLSNPNSPWGPHALGLSARSDTITEYNGGDGIIGIHGTSNPSSIGTAASLGCVRLPNELITLLHQLVPIGTPVEIRA